MNVKCCHCLLFVFLSMSMELCYTEEESLEAKVKSYEDVMRLHHAIDMDEARRKYDEAIMKMEDPYIPVINMDDMVRNINEQLEEDRKKEKENRGGRFKNLTSKEFLYIFLATVCLFSVIMSIKFCLVYIYPKFCKKKTQSTEVEKGISEETTTEQKETV